MISVIDLRECVWEMCGSAAKHRVVAADAVILCATQDNTGLVAL